jgi:hypothetical protein
MFEPKVSLNSTLRSVDWLDAQPWCNFVLLQPSCLPKGTKIFDQQLRPESSSARSSFRCLVGDEHRKLSMKQFLYDWAPPAYDYPSLWRNEEISPVADTPPPRPFPMNGDVAWIGLNFRKQRALSFNLKRTMIEITVMEGSFSDEELLGIYEGLKPIDEEQMVRILNTPFSSLCYLNRHPTTASDVPLSYWEYSRQKTSPIELRPIANALEPIFIPKPYGYFLNSIFSIGSPQQEVEYYYEHRELPGSYLRLLVTAEGHEHSIPYPPKLGDQYCKTEHLNIHNHDMYHAYLDENLGPHEIIWSHENSVLLLLIKPATWTSRIWLHKLLKDITA